MSDSSRQVGDVTRAEALSLLAGVSLGRIVYTENAMPAVRSASHLVEEGDIIARSHDGSAVLPERETVVAYQADEIDTGSRLGWSVVVTGPARPVVDSDEIERYAAVLPPWTGAESGQIIRVHPGIVTGYRLAEEPALAWPCDDTVADSTGADGTVSDDTATGSTVAGNTASGRSPLVTLIREGGAATIRLNLPERANALGYELAGELGGLVREAASDDGIRAVVITGTGKAFCSGFDLKANAETAQAGELDTDIALGLYNPIVTAIREMPKPVITAVNGAAAGAGASLALAGDLVAAAESAFFLLAFTRIGLVPDTGASLLVPARVGLTRAAEMALLGDRIPAAQAVEWGLINFAWPDSELAAKTSELAQRLASGPTRAYAGTKRELNTWMYGQLARHLELEMELQRELAKAPDFIEGATAFNEKRPPRFTGR